MANAVSIISAAGRTGVAKEVAVLASWTLDILGAFARAVWHANRWVVVVGAGIAGRAIAVVAGVRIYAIGFFTDQAIRRAVELFVTRRGGLADAVGTIRAFWAVPGTGTAIGWATSTVYAFTIPILAASYIITVVVIGASAQVVGIKTFVIGVA